MRKVTVPGEGSFLASVGLDAGAIAEALREHRCAQDPAMILKRGGCRSATRVRVPMDAEGGCGGKELVEAVVKERRLPLRWILVHRLGVPSRFARVPAIAARLEREGVAVPKVLAVSLRVRASADYMLAEYVRGTSLVGLFSELTGTARGVAEPESFFFALGFWVRALHDRGVWQRDMKGENVIVRPSAAGAQAFVLVDFDGVRFLGRSLGLSRRAKNLAQLLDSARDGEPQVRPALFHGYCSSGPPLAEEDLAARTLAALEAIRRRRDRLRSGQTVERPTESGS